eukprot:4300632-Heterocapsa_arctica.AAC.1
MCASSASVRTRPFAAPSMRRPRRSRRSRPRLGGRSSDYHPAHPQLHSLRCFPRPLVRVKL